MNMCSAPNVTVEDAVAIRMSRASKRGEKIRLMAYGHVADTPYIAMRESNDPMWMYITNRDFDETVRDALATVVETHPIVAEALRKKSANDEDPDIVRDKFIMKHGELYAPDDEEARQRGALSLLRQHGEFMLVLK